jgi:hypothetical protein
VNERNNNKNEIRMRKLLWEMRKQQIRMRKRLLKMRNGH